MLFRSVYELDDLIAANNTDITGAQATIDATKIDGKIYSLPYKTSSWFVVYNKDVFDAAGEPYPDGDWTWEEYAEVAARLTSGEGADKVYGSLNFQPTSMWWRVPANTKGAINPLEEELPVSQNHVPAKEHTLSTIAAWLQMHVEKLPNIQLYWYGSAAQSMRYIGATCGLQIPDS